MMLAQMRGRSLPCTGRPITPTADRRRCARRFVADLRGHRTLAIGQISIMLDTRMMPQVDADWSPPAVLAIASALHPAVTFAALLKR